MTQLIVEYPEKDMAAIESDRYADTSNNSLMVGAAEWSALYWTPYAESKGPTIAIIVALIHPTESAVKAAEPDFARLVTDASLFGRIAHVFLDYGEPGLVAARRACRAGGNIPSKARAFIEDTIALFERLVAEQLQYIEVVASRLCDREQRQIQKDCENELSHFREVNYKGVNYFEASRAGLNNLYPLLKVARKHALRIESLQAKVAERNYADSGWRENLAQKRAHDPYRQLWVELFAKPQRELIAELVDIRIKIGRNWPSALLILDHLDADVDDLLPVPRPNHVSRRDDEKARLAELKYHTRIRDALLAAKKSSRRVQEMLSISGIDLLVSKHLHEPAANRDEGLFERVTDIILANDVSRMDIFSAALADVENERSETSHQLELRERQSIQFNTRAVLASASLVQRVRESPEEIVTGSFREAIIVHFQLHLEKCLREKRNENASREAIWRQVQFVSAVGGLLFSAATLPFGGEATLPAALQMIRTASHVGLFLSGVATTIHGIASVVESIDDAERSLQKKLIQIGQMDTEGLTDLGSIIVRNRELIDTAPRELLTALITLAASAAIYPVGIALELEGYYYDIETIYQALGEEDVSDGQ